MRKTILVLNCYMRNSAAVIDGLRGGNYRLIGAHPESGKTGERWRDRWLKPAGLVEVLRHASYSDCDLFLKDIVRICQEHAVDGVIVTGTSPTNLVAQLKSEIEQQTHATVLTEHWEKMKQIADKASFSALCNELGIPSPPTIAIAEVADLEILHSRFTFPIILKPSDASASKGIRFIDGPGELREYQKTTAQADLSQFGAFVAQEVIAGDLYDAAGCAENGRSLGVITQQRLMTLYDFGGGGLINRTTDNPELRDACEKIMAATEWNGILEIDFIRDRGGAFYALECNPKIWGTTQLAIASGVNVIQQLVDVMLDKKHPEVVDHYEVDLVYKWVFPALMPYAWSRHPRKAGAILKRMWNTFKHYPGTRTIWNTRWGGIRHAINEFLDIVYFGH